MYIYMYICIYIWRFPEMKWGYPQIMHFNRIFHYKPSILGTPIYGTPLYCNIHMFNIYQHIIHSIYVLVKTRYTGEAHFFAGTWILIHLKYWISKVWSIPISNGLCKKSFGGIWLYKQWCAKPKVRTFLRTQKKLQDKSRTIHHFGDLDLHLSWLILPELSNFMIWFKSS